MSYFFYIPAGGGGGGGGGTPTPSDSAKRIDNLFTAGENIPAFKFVAAQADGRVYIADVADDTVQGRIVGMTLAPITAGLQGSVRQFGPITGGGWTFEMGKEVVLGLAGDPTQAAVPEGTFYAKVGYPLSSSSLMVDIDQVIDI